MLALVGGLAWLVKVRIVIITLLLGIELDREAAPIVAITRPLASSSCAPDTADTS